MRKDILIATNLSLIAGLGLSACKSIGASDFNPDSGNNPNSTEISPTMVPFPKIEPLNEKDIKVFLDNCQNCEELGITMETVAGGYFESDFLFHSKDKNDADYFYLNQGTSFEPLNWESTDSEFALVPKANEGDIYTGLKYFIWNPNVTDDSGNMIVTYQPDGTPNSAQKFILPSNNDIEPRLKRARFTKPEISPQPTLPPEVKEKIKLAGVDIKDMQYDKDGLHITLPDGEVIVLTNTDLQKGIYNGQDNVLQYRDEANQNVIYAYDTENKTFLESSKYIQKDKTDPEKYIQVKDWDELYALWTKEKMFLIPFDPENTYFPPLDKINRDYENYRNSMPDPEFNYWTPFGEKPEGMDPMFKFVNFTRLQKDALDGRLDNALIISEQVFNVDDDSFSVLHFIKIETDDAISVIEERTHLQFFLPRLDLDQEYFASSTTRTYTNYLKKNNLLTPDGLVPKMRDLVFDWFETGHVSDELSNMLFAFTNRMYNLPK